MATLSLTKQASAPGAALIAAHWTRDGPAEVDARMGRAALGIGGDLVFALTQSSVPNAICSADIPQPSGPALLRVDEVAFPQGAIAYRHIHPGPGIRTLVQGCLRLISDHETFKVGVGDGWFEGANSPVRAENTAQGHARFVRAMILPVAFKGRPSIQILDPADQGLPRLQVTHRHLDHVFTL